MKKIPNIASEKLIRKLLKHGFVYAPVKGKGSHTALLRVDEKENKHLVIIPNRNLIPKGTLLSIMKQSGLTREEFLEIIQ
jgi:predicted RNA binding protein YcfA (HicA-like mRNA interferase family)